jgi:hypothetical protein
MASLKTNTGLEVQLKCKSTCLASAKSSVQTPVLPKNQQQNKTTSCNYSESLNYICKLNMCT